jgi:hypothetical protein
MSVQPLKARVKNGRLVLDEPSDRPEGEIVELVPLDDLLASGGDDLADSERALLHRALDEGVDDFEKGDTEDAFEFLARLKASREDPDRQAGPPSGGKGK